MKDLIVVSKFKKGDKVATLHSRFNSDLPRESGARLFLFSGWNPLPVRGGVFIHLFSSP